MDEPIKAQRGKWTRQLPFYSFALCDQYRGRRYPSGGSRQSFYLFLWGLRSTERSASFKVFRDIILTVDSELHLQANCLSMLCCKHSSRHVALGKMGL
jgi:hypothetical protein